MYSHVFSPLRVAGHLLKNRIISAPSTIHTAANGEPYPSEKGICFFEARAKAGAGLVTCANVAIGAAQNDGVHSGWDITVPNHTNRLCDLSERIHLHGAKCTMELIGVFPDGYTVSDGCSIMGMGIGREIPKEVMEDFKNKYVESAIGIKKSGFDGVMLHFGHSIPIAQFLSPLTNKREDEYGGSFEGRIKYPLEILKAIREAVGKDMIIDVRMSVSEFEEGGIDVREGISIAEAISPYCDIIQASCGMHNSDWMTATHPCGFLPPNPNVRFAEALKNSGRVSALITAIGGIGSLADAEEIISSGKADFIAAARSFIADIDWINKSIAEQVEDVTPCIKCMRCHDSDNYEHHMQCAVNPRVGLEKAIDAITPSTSPRKVAVIGGGPAGITAALTASRRGHEVDLFEKSGSLGGTLRFASYVPFKYPLKEYLNYLIAQVERSTVRVNLGKEISPDELRSAYDAVIIAVGAEPVRPRIGGIDRAITAIDVYGQEDSLGDDVFVVGGGQVGCETALHLARLGKRVTLAELQSDVAPDASKTHRDELLVEMKKQENLSIRTDRVCKEILPDRVICESNITNEEEAYLADDVIVAVGMRSKIELADTFVGISGVTEVVGDCVRPRTLEWAVKEGFYAAMNI